MEARQHHVTERRWHVIRRYSPSTQYHINCQSGATNDISQNNPSWMVVFWAQRQLPGYCHAASSFSMVADITTVYFGHAKPTRTVTDSDVRFWMVLQLCVLPRIRKWRSSWPSCALSYRNGSYEFRATKRLVAGARMRTGYVHVLRRSALKFWRGDEYRSRRPVTPAYVVKIDGSDLQMRISPARNTHRRVRVRAPDYHRIRVRGFRESLARPASGG